ncbi:M28 family metallopeptidase [Thalassotalea profundi]|uniref:Zn-dependent exopeptidase M28 n=1 Tax=Thalassotalea profundi TaxID=2036687 RepID=A0ABQ3ISS5_9GAMM|nr:M28 family metallopeptidase [Thalassotalea profundi]GHE89753.1 Zn-dependent exopeptidase M28 [Thalassotalea profundi]
MYKIPSLLLTFILYTLFTFSVHSQTILKSEFSASVNKYLQEIADPVKGIGAREAGSAKEKETIIYVGKNFKEMGLNVSVQPFSLTKGELTSANVIADLNSNKAKTLVLAAHLDSTGAEHGSHGATDNATGLAALLTVAEELAHKENLPYNIRFIAFGAEEVGLLGAKYYVKNLLEESGTAENILAMINLDTIAGGDFLYVHSAHTTPYKCGDIKAKYNSDTHVRDALFSLSSSLINKAQQYIIHPAYEGYPEGVTGGWSDHAPFACAGVPIAYIESTNFTINGKDGYDGYSQSDNAALWDCFDKTTHSACERKEENQWGHIWHTKSDQLAIMDQLFSQRLTQQLTASVEVLIAFLSNYKLDEIENNQMNNQ